nr:ribonuclease H-like domain-containing protein [Tanacetum cinerariifolium]
MAGKSTRSNTANDTNPPNEIADEVARQLNIALPNLLTQLVQALGGNRVNQREATPSCIIKTFRASGAKEFFRTKGAVGLLTWFESIEVVLHITKCLAESQVEFASSMLQGRALTWWNTLVQTRGRAAAIAQSWEDFKKLLMEEYCPDDEVEKLESEFWNHKMVGSDIDGNPKGGKIPGKGKIRTWKLDFDDVYFVKELKFNLFSISQMCDKKNSVLFTDTECIVLSSEFKLPDENQVLLRVPKENNMYNVDLKNIVPSEDLTCLFTKKTLDESNLWHRRLGHINFKTMNKLVKVLWMKGIKREFSVPRTHQQNGIAERKIRTLIEAARTMLADLLLPIPFWSKAVNIACYVQNRVLVTKPQNKTPYELLLFMRPFGCHVTILNTLDPLGKFDRKADEGFLVGYSVSSKAFRVFNSRTQIVQETLHINFLENKPNVAGSGPTWLFDIDTLTKNMNYQLVIVGNQSNPSAGVQEQFDAEKAGEENVQKYLLFPLWSSGSKNP